MASSSQLTDDAPAQTDVSFFIPERPPQNGIPQVPPLHRGTALDYFAQSQFYDRTCLNEELKMQLNLSPQDRAEKLKRLPGVLYLLDEERTQELPPTPTEPAHALYVVRKVKRTLGPGPPASRETTLRFYYILDRVVFEAPSLAAVLRARMLTLSWHLREAFALCEKSQKGSRASSSNGGDSTSKPGNKRARDDQANPRER